MYYEIVNHPLIAPLLEKPAMRPVRKLKRALFGYRPEPEKPSFIADSATHEISSPWSEEQADNATLVRTSEESAHELDSSLRIPTKPAMHSNRKPATDSDLKPAGIPI